MEWLYPLQFLDNDSISTSFIFILYGLSALNLLLGIFQWKQWIRIPIYLTIIAGAWGLLFEKGRGFEWYLSVGGILQHDVTIVIQEWSLSTLGAETRTLILILGWGILVTTVQSLALDRSSIGLFAGASIIYLLCLEALLGLEVFADIVRTSLLLMVLIAMLSLSRLREHSSTPHEFLNLRYVQWFISVCIVVSMAVCVAWIGDKVVSAEPTKKVNLEAAMDTFKDWTGLSMYRHTSKQATTGYGAGEGDMGAPLQVSNEIVFTAVSPISTYWKGETFGYYDGRRWAEPQVYFQSIDMKGEIQGSYRTEEREKESIIQTLNFIPSKTGEFPLFNGGNIERVLNITTENGEKPIYLLHDEISDTLKFPAATGSSPVKNYQIEVAIPLIQTNVLRNSSGPDLESVTERYLQLPEELPLRVKVLGNEITTHMTNRYDAVVAIETFLKNQYTYSLKTSVPPSNEDFVDHFLFQSKIGYCNHFATSMVILLRSQDIPARFVKGYSPGMLETGSQDTYVIKSLNAHSWVEVYFPQIGWIPFDPTPGFSTIHEKSEPIIINNQNAESKNIVDSVVDVYTNLVHFFGKIFINLQYSLTPEVAYMLIGMNLAVVLIIASVWRIYQGRRYFFLWRLRFITRNTFPQKEQMLKASWIVWDEFERKFGCIPQGITVREYIYSIQDENLRKEILQFTEQWERITYGETSINRTYSILFLQRCTQLAHLLSN
ncbi:transglutaminase-like domain-containing protein [Paenibacillus crassostreae]|nr:transglutaminase-like domain-containing protein [Paenibacillus crassostreae]